MTHMTGLRFTGNLTFTEEGGNRSRRLHRQLSRGPGHSFLLPGQVPVTESASSLAAGLCGIFPGGSGAWAPTGQQTCPPGLASLWLPWACGLGRETRQAGTQQLK